MGQVSIELTDDKEAFAPGERLTGQVRWSLESNPNSLELSLFWYTTGKGTRDVGVIDTLDIDNPGSLGSKDFAFDLPQGPYSFSGRLISLVWALEVTEPDSGETTRREIVLSPTGHEVVLGSA